MYYIRKKGSKSKQAYAGPILAKVGIQAATFVEWPLAEAAAGKMFKVSKIQFEVVEGEPEPATPLDLSDVVNIQLDESQPVGGSVNVGEVARMPKHFFPKQPDDEANRPLVVCEVSGGVAEEGLILPGQGKPYLLFLDWDNINDGDAQQTWDDMPQWVRDHMTRLQPQAMQSILDEITRQNLPCCDSCGSECEAHELVEGKCEECRTADEGLDDEDDKAEPPCPTCGNHKIDCSCIAGEQDEEGPANG